MLHQPQVWPHGPILSAIPFTLYIAADVAVLVKNGRILQNLMTVVDVALAMAIVCAHGEQIVRGFASVFHLPAFVFWPLFATLFTIRACLRISSRTVQEKHVRDGGNVSVTESRQ